MNVSSLKRKSALPFKQVTTTLPGVKVPSRSENLTGTEKESTT